MKGKEKGKISMHGMGKIQYITTNEPKNKFKLQQHDTHNKKCI